MKKTGIIKQCLNCKKEIYVPAWLEKQGGGKFCSSECQYQAMRGKTPWNKGKIMPFIPRKMPKGFLPVKAFKKGSIPWNKGLEIEQTRNEKNGSWKGDEVGYDALHDWVKRRLGFPKQCEHCKTTEARVYQWANKSGEYKRDITDWLRLCIPCHKKYDLSRENKKLVFTLKSKRMVRIRAL